MARLAAPARVAQLADEPRYGPGGRRYRAEVTSRIHHITIDCRDPHALAGFWAQVLGFVDEPEFPNEPGDDEALLVDPTGHHPSVLFIRVPEAKAVKNRVHLDLQPDRLRDEEVGRVVSLGASLVDDQRRPDGTGWAVLADPEGNEFCVERSRAELAERAGPGTSVPAASVEQPDADLLLPDRAALESMLDLQRARVVAKVAGVQPHHAVARPVGSPTSIAGLVKHLALVEDSWFAEDLRGEPRAGWYAGIDFEADRDWEFLTAADELMTLQVERYETACERARSLAATVDDLDAPVTPGGEDRRHDGAPPFTLRWLYLHMIEETARHLGHIDLLREHLDGTTGD